MPRFPSSTREVPAAGVVPRHVAIIMDGNGRWATSRHLPRVTGHAKGVDAVRRTVEGCARSGVEYLTLFAYSSENWRRPADEVSVLMRLFITALEREVTKLCDNGIRLRVVGDLGRFEPRLRELIAEAEQRTAGNDRLSLTIAANYGGRWDILQATRALLAARPELALDPGRIAEEDIAAHLAMAWAPEPDLFIRTGGEQRISNFLLWQLAYTELLFIDTLWPDVDAAVMDAAVADFARRERRFGMTGEQVAAGATP